VKDIREAAIKHVIPARRTKFLWATILAQVAKKDACDGSLGDLLLEIIGVCLKKLQDKAILSLWLQTETGGGDDPGELLAMMSACTWKWNFWPK
jgi:hypothetical protein